MQYPSTPADRGHLLRRVICALSFTLLAMAVFHSAQASTNSPAPFYGSPYTSFWSYGHRDSTIPEAVQADWIGYSENWHVVPYGTLQCTHTFTPYSDGQVTGDFGSVTYHGHCHGGNDIFGTLQCPPGYKLVNKTCVATGPYQVSIFSSPAFIPTSTYAGKQTNYHVWTESDLILHLTRGGQPVSGMSIPLQSSRGLLADDISPMNPGTDSNGHAGATVSTWRQPGDSTISSASSTIETAEPANISWLPAQYQSPFLLTCYVVSLESHFLKSKLATAPGLFGKKYHEGFLVDTAMQGTGKALDGTYIHYQGNGRYKPESCPLTASTACAVDGVTVAVDRHVIPLRSHITISGKGDRLAQDTGGGIKRYHIDLFYGFRRHACILLGKSYGHTVTLESYGN